MEVGYSLELTDDGSRIDKGSLKIPKIEREKFIEIFKISLESSFPFGGADQFGGYYGSPTTNLRFEDGSLLGIYGRVTKEQRDLLLYYLNLWNKNEA